eukprot:160171-Amorphochlora_amoeboformis.AAC.1
MQYRLHHESKAEPHALKEQHGRRRMYVKNSFRLPMDRSCPASYQSRLNLRYGPLASPIAIAKALGPWCVITSFQGPARRGERTNTSLRRRMGRAGSTLRRKSRNPTAS